MKRRFLLYGLVVFGVLASVSSSVGSSDYSVPPVPALDDQPAPTYQVPNKPNATPQEVIDELEAQSFRQSRTADIPYQLGLAYAQRGQFDRAVQEFQAALKIDPHHVQAWTNLAVNLDHLGKLDEALKAFQTATQVDPSNGNAWAGFALELMYPHRYDDAGTALAEGFKVDPRSKRLWNALGILRNLQQNYPAAIDALNQAVQIDPDYGVAWCNLGMAQVAMKKDDDAIVSFQKAVQTNPRLSSAWLNLAWGYSEKKQWNDSYAAAKQATLALPTTANAWLALAHSSFALSKVEESVESFHQAFDVLDYKRTCLKNDHDYAEALNEYGRATVAINHFDDAEKILNESFLRNPNSVMTWAGLGFLRLRQKRWDESIKADQKSIQLDPNQASTWENLGIAYSVGLHQPTEALQALQKSLALDPTRGQVWFDVGVVYEQLGRLTDAVDAYRKAVGYAPSLFDAWGRLALTTSNQSESDKAIAQAIALNPKDATNYVAAGTIFSRRQNWPQAEKAFQTATQLAPTESQNWQLLAGALFSQKKFSAAISVEQNAIQYGSQLPNVDLAKLWSSLAELHFDCGFEKGKSEWQASVDDITHATTLDSINPHYWYNMAVYQKALGNVDAGEAALTKCQQLGGIVGLVTSATTFASLVVKRPSSPNPEKIVQQTEDNSRILAIQKLIIDKKIDEALTAAQQETQTHPNSALSWYVLGEALKVHRRNDEAISAYLKANAINPNYWQAWNELGICYVLEGKSSEAIDSLSKSINLMPYVPLNWNLLRLSYVRLKDLKAGESKLSDLLSAHPDAAYGWSVLSAIQTDEGMPDNAQVSLQKAIDAYSNSINSTPDKPDAWNGLFHCYADHNNFIDGEDKMEDLAKAHPESSLGWWFLGLLQQQEKMPMVALTNFQKAADLKPDCALGWEGFGVAYLNLKTPDKALDCFTRALQLQPGYADALNGVGISYAMMGKPDMAVDAFKQAIQANPKNVQALANLVGAYSTLHQWDLAKAACDTLAQIDPQTAAKLRLKFPSTSSSPVQVVAPAQPSAPEQSQASAPSQTTLPVP